MSLKQRFLDRVVLITGGAGGMGQAHVRAFVAEGAHVVIADVNDEVGAALAAEIGDAAMFVHLDVTGAESWDAAIAQTQSRFGPIDVLVNNAALLKFDAVDTADIGDFRQAIDVNLTGPFIGMRAVLPGMRARRSGVVTNIVSAGGMIAYQGSIAYVAAKWGLRGMTRAAAMDLAGTGVRINAVFPGPTRTPMIADFSEAYEQALVANQVLPRWGEPEEVSAALLFICSDDASYCTGTEFSVDGGATLGQVTPRPETV